jgi:SSS family solute:Na+ symporter
MVITSLQYVAGGAILSSLLPEVFSYRTGMLVSAATFIGITLIGGYWAAGLSNVINVIVIYVGIVTGVILCVAHAGGIGAVYASLPPGDHWFDPFKGVGMAAIGAWFAVLITMAFTTQAVGQIAFAAKDEASARRGFVIGGLLIFPVGFLCAIFGGVSVEWCFFRCSGVVTV